MPAPQRNQPPPDLGVRGLPTHVVAELARDLLALLWPSRCLGCGRADRVLCAECRRDVQGYGQAPVVVDGLGVPCVAAAPYEGVVRATLLAYKHGGAHGFGRLLGERLLAPLHALLDVLVEETPRSGPPVVLVPVPSRPQQVRARGWRPVDDLIRVARYRSTRPFALVRALRTLPGRTGQVGLASDARERNAQRIAVRARVAPRVRGRPVVLVDDIVTTGATLRAAVAVLEQAGARVLGVVALCAAGRRDTPQHSEWNLTGEKG